MTETRTIGDGQTVPADIFETACGIVMNARSLKSVSRHTDVVDAIALTLLSERNACAAIFDEMARVTRLSPDPGGRANQYEYYAGLIRDRVPNPITNGD